MKRKFTLIFGVLLIIISLHSCQNFLGISVNDFCLSYKEFYIKYWGVQTDLEVNNKLSKGKFEGENCYYTVLTPGHPFVGPRGDENIVFIVDNREKPIKEILYYISNNLLYHDISGPTRLISIISILNNWNYDETNQNIREIRTWMLNNYKYSERKIIFGKVDLFPKHFSYGILISIVKK